jgi:hypothetical protein
MYDPMHVGGGIVVFSLQYNNNISCILMHFLHARAPSISDGAKSFGANEIANGGI